MSAAGTMLIRCDADVAIGTGHVMRCLALAQAWQDAGGYAIFAMAEATPAVEERLRSEGFEVVRPSVRIGSGADAREFALLARKHTVSWVVVDGYEFGSEYQATLKSLGLKLLFIDDNGHAGHYSADFVLNQNAHASEAFYPSRDQSTRLLLGPRFAMLRREFTAWRGWKRDIPPVARRILVTMGGSDPDNVTQRVVEAISSEGEFEATVVVGGSNPHLARLHEFVGVERRPVRLVENATNMPELIASADVAVAGAGTTSWEMSFLGLPALLIVLADNQQGIADELGKHQIAGYLGRYSEVNQITIAAELRNLANSPIRRRIMSDRGRVLVDGYGSLRVVAALRREALSIRRVEKGDCKLLWEWANDPVARGASFSIEDIPWDEHVEWFQGKLNDDNCRIFVALDASTVPVGQIRFDKHGADDADIDIIVDSRFRGLGYASRLIDLGTSWAFTEWGLKQLNAFIKHENVASAKAFERAGFENVENMTIKGQSAIRYVRMAK